MEFINNNRIRHDYVRLVGRPALYLGEAMNATPENLEPLYDIINDRCFPAPFLKMRDIGLLMTGGLIFCDSLDEVASLFDQVVGDDGPTKVNKYRGPWRVYAEIIDAEGQTRTENT